MNAIDDELDWPDYFSRTAPEEREECDKFDVGYARTKRELTQEMDRLGVDDWTLYEKTGRNADPGVLIQWQEGAKVYAIGCDNYTQKSDNLREAVYWLQETRKRRDRPVQTGQEEFAAARLPSGANPDDTTPGEDLTAAYTILGVSPPTNEQEVANAFNDKAKDLHPDQGGTKSAFNALKTARDTVLNQL